MGLLCAKEHEEIQKVRDKKEDACYPTTQSLHDAIMSIDGMPRWSKIMTYRVLRNMNFAWLENHEINVEMLNDNGHVAER